jgi:hypothetical protein
MNQDGGGRGSKSTDLKITFDEAWVNLFFHSGVPVVTENGNTTVTY